MTDRPARVPAQSSPSATAAYVRVYEEEQPRLVAYARSLTRNTWAAEDLVAEAHFRVWRRLAAGHEIDNVPAYLMTTVRHLASSAASATHETPRDPQIPEQGWAASDRHAADPAEQVSSTDLLVRVLGELPERWVRALWLADAEGQPLETVGRQIGAKQGATAVLLHRAREGMRQAFLRSQTEAPDDPACEVHWVRMPAYVRGSATPRQSERLLAHVDTCDDCRGRLAVLIRANNRLPALAGPALLVFAVGGGGTGKFLASLTAGSVGSAGSVPVTGQGLLHTARAAGPKTKAALASGTAAAAAVAVVLSLGVNQSPGTVTSPGRAPVAQGPVAGPSEGAVGETPGSSRPVEVERGWTEGGGARAVVPAVTGEVGDGQPESGVQGAGGSGGSANSTGSGSSSGNSSGSDGGDVVVAPEAPEQPAPEAPAPSPTPVEPTPETPAPSPTPVAPAPGDEEPEPPAEPPSEPEPPAEPPAEPEPAPKPPAEPPSKPEPAPKPPAEPPSEPEPAPKPPKEHQPEPQPEPEPAPEPEKPEPGAPGKDTPVPEPGTPTPADPPPVEETPAPPTYSEPPAVPEQPAAPEPPAETPEPPVTPPPPTTGDDCGRDGSEPLDPGVAQVPPSWRPDTPPPPHSEEINVHGGVAGTLG